MSYFRKTRLIAFLFMLVVYLMIMGLYYKQTHAIIIQETEKNIENILLSNRALSNLVADIQKDEILKLQNEGVLDKEYFSAALLSSSYVTTRVNEYANTERKKMGYEPITFKYASANPTNPNNQADVHDLMVFQKFLDNEITTYKEVIEDDGQKYLYYAIAGRTIEEKCLQCHSTPERAPQGLVDYYGDKNGFGYKVGDLSSIIYVTVPLENIYLENDKAFKGIAFGVFVVFILLFVLAERIHTRLKEKEKELQKAYLLREKDHQKATSLKTTLSNLNEHIIRTVFDTYGITIEISDALCKLSGYNRHELLGQEFCMFRHKDMSEIVFQEIWKTLMEGRVWKGELKNMTKDGKVFWLETTITPLRDEENTLYAFEAIMRSITEEKALQEDVNLDHLTKLFNRRNFEAKFDNEKNRAKRDKKFFALIMIDIDYFKDYNDNYGHNQGDKALQAVAASLKNSFRRASDSIFRIGGEEFAVLSSDTSEKALIEAANFACSRLEGEQIEHLYSKANKYLTISIGIAILDPMYDSDISFNEMYDYSDSALYQAKTEGRNRVKPVVID